MHLNFLVFLSKRPITVLKIISHSNFNKNLLETSNSPLLILISNQNLNIAEVIVQS